jgi:hypothetical protein
MQGERRGKQEEGMKAGAEGSHKQKARRFWGIGLLLMLVGTVIPVVSIYLGVSNLSQTLVQLVMPGAYEIEFYGPGIYTAFHETTNDKKEAGYGTLPINPPKRRNPKSGMEYLEDPIKYLTCRIKSLKSGADVPLDREFSGPEVPKNIFPYFLGKRTGFPFFLFSGSFETKRVRDNTLYGLLCRA